VTGSVGDDLDFGEGVSTMAWIKVGSNEVEFYFLLNEINYMYI
jgi:hypothetical protein